MARLSIYLAAAALALMIVATEARAELEQGVVGGAEVGMNDFTDAALQNRKMLGLKKIAGLLSKKKEEKVVVVTPSPPPPPPVKVIVAKKPKIELPDIKSKLLDLKG